ncbi:MAG: hypothetical protein M1G31_26500 [Pseudanabaena sp. Salubria-1]|nr:hypothetical protein [Pseudanabaena sp. Salubria-1]
MKYHEFIKISSDKGSGLLWLCEVGIDPLIASNAASAVGGQHLNQWCWAACIETVFRCYGYIVPQADIVRQTWGTVVNRPADLSEILSNLNRDWVDVYGRRFLVASNAALPANLVTADAANGQKILVSGDALWANLGIAIQDLSQNMPLIIGRKDHAMVLTSLRWLTDGRSIVTDAVVRDPCPNAGRRILSAEEWDKTLFLASIRIYEA